MFSLNDLNIFSFDKFIDELLNILNYSSITLLLDFYLGYLFSLSLKQILLILLRRSISIFYEKFKFEFLN
jgi:hypothetical protein